MDEVIDIINQLQDVFSVSGFPGIDLPQIVVVGAQSSGKSSVLEHIVGKSFLPRGTGIVTRCPLVLQMVQMPGKTNDINEYAIFQQDKFKVFTDLSVITKEIEDETDRLAGANKGICHTPIRLKIYSPSFINLTLVDLPGLTTIPVGDQPSDIEEQTKSLILSYIENPKSIILAVTPANVDMATSESLKLAKEVDLEGKRTIAVITKLDLMDEGTDAWDMLNGKVIPVKLGIIGVVNRSQKNIKDAKSIALSLEDEVKFFNTKYKKIASKNGSQFLKKRVQQILVSHIKSCMPELRSIIKEQLLMRKQELKKINDNDLDKPTLLLDLMTTFSNSYISAIKGKLTTIKSKELYGGARINYIFQESFSKSLNSVGALDGLKKADIIAAMKNSSGVSTAIFVPEVAFELLVKYQIERLRSPCLQCVDLVHKELNLMIQDCIGDPRLGLKCYPKMQVELDTAVTELLQTRYPFTTEMVEFFINAQIAFINTTHPDFLTNAVQSVHDQFAKYEKSRQEGAGAPVPQNQALPYFMMANGEGSSILTEPEFMQFQQQLTALAQLLQSTDTDLKEYKKNRDVILIRELIKSYFSIVKKTIQDTVPKIVMHSLVNFVVENLQRELMARLYKSYPEDLLEELDVITEKRKELKKDISALEQANLIVNKISPSGIRMRPSLNFQEDTCEYSFSEL